MVALDGKGILEDFVSQLLKPAKTTTTPTVHQFSQLHTSPRSAYELSQEWRIFQQNSPSLSRIHGNHRGDLQTSLRKATAPCAADLTDLIRNIIGIDGNGNEIEGRTRDNSAYIQALSQVSAQGNQQYQKLLMETQAAEADITAFLGLDNMGHSDIVDARDNENVHERAID